MINLFVIDDHPVFINGLKTLFNAEEDNIKVSNCATSAKEALPMLKRSMAKVVILDLVMPEISGVDFCHVIKKQFPDKKVIILTGSLNKVLLYKVWRNKADAILLKYCGKDELIDTIHDVLAGKRMVGENVPDFDDYYDETVTKSVTLTRSEKTILEKLAEGKTRKEISIILGSTLNAVSFHCKNIFTKLNQTKVVMAVEEARKLGLIE
jgi:DNA-binding NarL/FixJ family response regulator